MEAGIRREISGEVKWGAVRTSSQASGGEFSAARFGDVRQPCAARHLDRERVDGQALRASSRCTSCARLAASGQSAAEFQLRDQPVDVFGRDAIGDDGTRDSWAPRRGARRPPCRAGQNLRRNPSRRGRESIASRDPDPRTRSRFPRGGRQWQYSVRSRNEENQVGGVTSWSRMMRDIARDCCLAVLLPNSTHSGIF